MKKIIIAFVLGAAITAGAFGLAYGLPITNAAEKTIQAKAAEETMQPCNEMMKSPEMQNMMKSMMSQADTKAMDPKAVEGMMKQCMEMMKNPEMQTMMNSMHKNNSASEDMNHSVHHQ